MAVVDVFHVLSFYFCKIDVNIMASSPKILAVLGLVNPDDEGVVEFL